MHFYMYSNNEVLDLKDYEKYKRLSLNVASLFLSDDELHDRGKLIEHCGDLIQFDKENNLVSANFCRQRLCPNCQRRNSLKLYSKFKRIESKLLSDGFCFAHLVLTCQNCESDELTKTIKLLYDASSKFFKDKKVKQGFKGALRCLEVSYNRTNCNYHPHLHCLIAVKKSYFTSRYYLNREKIADIWKKCLKIDYNPQVWITKCDDNALAEVVKYAVKPLELTTSDVVRLSVLKTLHHGLHGRRLLQTYGIIKEVAKQLNIDLNEEDSDCVSNSDSDEIKTYIFNFNTLKYEQNNFKLK